MMPAQVYINNLYCWLRIPNEKKYLEVTCIENGNEVFNKREIRFIIGGGDSEIEEILNYPVGNFENTESYNSEELLQEYKTDNIKFI